MAEPNALQDVRRYVSMLHKRRGIILTCLGVSLLVAILYNYTTRPVYQATTQILIDRDTPDVLPNKELVDLVQSGADYYQTQYQLLKSRALAEKVVERLALQKSPELATGPMMSPWERAQRLMGRPPASTVDQNGMPLSPTVAAFRSRIDVEPVPGSRLVNVRFRAYEPSVAARAVNALAQLYIEQSLEFRFTTSTEASGWLADRLKEQQGRLETAEKALQEYREREGLVNQEEREALVDQKLEALNAAVLEARTDRIAKETLYNQVSTLSPERMESFPAVMGSEAVQSLKVELSTLQKEEARLAETLGDRHPDMVRVRSQMRAVQEKLRYEIRNVARSAETEYRAALSREARLQASLEGVKEEAQGSNRKAIEYGVLKREVETNQQLYKELLTKAQQTGLETELKTTNIRIIEKAEPPGGPILPRKTRNLQFGALIGLALGIGLTLLFEHLDNSFKTPDDVKQQLGVPFIGMVPDLEAKGAGGARPGGSPLITKNPSSPVAESYRVIRTNLIFTSAEGRGRSVIVTSANPGEGKTTTVANLAASLAMTGAKVLAVDADLRRPTLHSHFGVVKTPGLSDLIVGKMPASQCIQTTRFKGLQVLPCGYIPPNPVELLGSASMKQIVDALRSHYDWVVVDTPPILAMADTSVMSPLVEGVVLVIAAEAVSRDAVHRAVDQVQNVGGKVLGVVLNKVNLERNSYYYSQYYGEYYRSYYAEGSGGSAESGSRASGSRSATRLARRS